MLHQLLEHPVESGKAVLASYCITAVASVMAKTPVALACSNTSTPDGMRNSKCGETRLHVLCCSIPCANTSRECWTGTTCMAIHSGLCEKNACAALSLSSTMLHMGSARRSRFSGGPSGTLLACWALESPLRQ